MPADDVVIRLGSVNAARPNMRALQQDLTDLRQELQALDGEDVEPEVRAEVQAALADLDQVEAELQQLQGQDAEVQARADVGGASGDLGRVESELRRLDGQTAEMRVRVDSNQAASDMEGMKSKLGGAAASLGQGIGQAVGGALMDAISGTLGKAIEQETSTAIANAQFAGDPETQRRAGEIAGRLYAQAYGESLGEVQQAVFQVITSSKQMRDASESDIQAVTSAAMDLSTVWQLDVAESMRAAGQLVRNEMVPDTVTGLGLIDAAMRDLGPAAEDALDTITEYSTQFRQLGLDGPRAMNMVSQAIEAGAPSTDLAADALKEFTLIAQAMSDDTVAAYQEIGLNGRQMGDDISAGGDRATTALDLTLERLRGVKDPADQARLAVALFGTQAEDLQDALFAMDPTPTANAYTNLKDTLNEVSQTVSDTSTNHALQAARGAEGVITAMGDEQAATESAVNAGIGFLGLWNDAFGGTSDAAATASQNIGARTNEAGRAMLDNMSNGVNAAVGVVQGMPGKVGTALSGLFDRGSAAGQDLAAGFQGGIQAKAQSIINTVRQMAINATGVFRSSIQSRSPSRVTHKLGEMFDQGFIDGIEARRGQVAAAAHGTAMAATEQLQPGSNLGRGGAGGQLAPAGASTSTGMVVEFGGATDTAFAAAFMQLVRTGKIQIKATS